MEKANWRAIFYPSEKRSGAAAISSTARLIRAFRIFLPPRRHLTFFWPIHREGFAPKTRQGRWPPLLFQGADKPQAWIGSLGKACHSWHWGLILGHPSCPAIAIPLHRGHPASLTLTDIAVAVKTLAMAAEGHMGRTGEQAPMFLLWLQMGGVHSNPTVKPNSPKEKHLWAGATDMPPLGAA